ncbi:unnamed protein product [Paramecium octaurelia]|uniref:Uncharacterized protein n=1 Tax=Paramecium octaurelia TaxID=43137 RepID=A0A8S1W7U0_PAROT|nr:unnamed protein product [Paramecium octaurelia]
MEITITCKTFSQRILFGVDYSECIQKGSQIELLNQQSSNQINENETAGFNTSASIIFYFRSSFVMLSKLLLRLLAKSKEKRVLKTKKQIKILQTKANQCRKGFNLQQY